MRPAKAITLDVEVTQGPRVKLMVSGSEIFERRFEKTGAGLPGGRGGRGLLEEGKRNLRERLERQGYFDATVDYTTETQKAATSANGFVGNGRNDHVPSVPRR